MGNPFGLLASEAGYQLQIQVLSSQRGFYIGTANEMDPCPVSQSNTTKPVCRPILLLKKGNGRSVNMIRYRRLHHGKSRN
jgi:hypothetical protein